MSTHFNDVLSFGSRFIAGRCDELDDLADSLDQVGNGRLANRLRMIAKSVSKANDETMQAYHRDLQQTYDNQMRETGRILTTLITACRQGDQHENQG